MQKHDVLHKKYSSYNCSYVDAFFSYLTSKVHKSEHFIHGLQFYGSFIGMKKDYNINVADDIGLSTRK